MWEIVMDEGKIIQELLECNELYKDSDFTPSNASLYKNDDASTIPEYAVNEEPVTWARPADFADNPDYFKSTSGCGVLKEGVMDDSWFLGAVAAIALHPEGLIENLFVSENVDDFKNYGVYTCRFYKDGEWVNVTCDTSLPITKSTSSRGNIVYGSCVDRNELWIPLLEKAYAKLHGSYESALASGNVMEALLDCTGGSVQLLSLDESAWDKCHRKFKSNNSTQSFIMCAQLSELTSSYGELTTDGILRNRLYTVLYMTQVDKNRRFVKLRNPWSKGVWKGPWASDDSLWEDHHQVESALRLDPRAEFSRSGTDGTFWMAFEDFCDIFNELYVTQVFPTSDFTYAVKGEWLGESAAGPPSSSLKSQTTTKQQKDTKGWEVKADSEADWFKNPQYQVRVSEPTKVCISLLQRDAKLYGGGDNFDINLLVIQPPRSGRVWEVMEEDIVARVSASNSTKVLPSREVCVETLKLEASKRPYVIVPFTSSPNVEMEFFLRVFSPSSLRVTELPAPEKVVVYGSWTKDNGGTCGGPLLKGQTTGRENPSWCHNEQFWCNILPAEESTQDTFPLKLVLKKTIESAAPVLVKKVSAMSSGVFSPTSGSSKKNKGTVEKHSSQLIGLTVLKPISHAHEKKKASKIGDAKVNFLGEKEPVLDERISPPRRSKAAAVKPITSAMKAANPERRLVVSPDEWCRISDYSRTSVASMFLPKVSREWAPEGLIVVPTAGAPNAVAESTTYTLEAYTSSSNKLNLSSLENNSSKTVEGVWVDGTSAGCHLNSEWKKNPKFYLRIKSGKPVKVKITLSRSEAEWKTKCKRNTVGSMMGFYLFQGTTFNRIADGGTTSVSANGRSWCETDFVPMNSQSSPDNLTLPPIFDDPYVIIPATYEPKQNGRFLVSVSMVRNENCQFSLSTEP